MIRNQIIKFLDLTTLQDLRDLVTELEHWPGDTAIDIREAKGDQRDSEPNSITLIER